MEMLPVGYRPGTEELQICTEQYGEKSLGITQRLDEKGEIT